MIRLNRNISFFLMVLVFVLFVSNAQGGTTIPSGTIVDTTWSLSGSPYQIEGDIFVAGLTIDPGVTVEFAGNYKFEVAGTLNAVGNKAEPIIFTRGVDNSDGWEGINFNQSNNDCRLEYCKIEGAVDGGIKIINVMEPPLIKNTIINDNSRYHNGGGIFIENSGPVTLTECSIIDNTSFNNSGGQPYAGGIYTNGIIVLNNCVISNNLVKATGSTGGHKYARGGGIYVNGELLIRNSVIANNKIEATGSNSNMHSLGAGVYVNGNADIENCIFDNNEAYARQTGGWFSLTQYEQGGGIYIDGLSATAQITNSTFYKNIAHTSGGGIHVNQGTTILKNSILWENNANQISGDAIVTYSDVQDCYEGEGNICLNPVFMSESNLQIVKGSPCIDAGDPDPQYNDKCFPPYQGTERNDMGAHGGPGGCDWLTPENVAYYFIVDRPIVDLWQYALELHAITWEGEEWIVGSSWSIDDPSIAILNNSTLTGLQNGHVVVSTSYLGANYSQTVYFKSYGYFESESNDSIATSDDLTEYEFMEGELLNSDFDYYKLTTSQFKSVELAYFSRSLTADVLIEVLDHSGNLIARGTSMDGENIRIHVGFRSGDYYIRLSSAGDIDNDETYDIVYGTVDPALNLVFEAESNNNPSDADDLIFDQTVEGHLTTVNDQDFFRILLDAPVYVDLVFQCQGIDPEKQFAIAIYNSSEENLINSFIVSEGQSVALPMGLNIAEYFIKVSGIVGVVETELPYALSLRTSSHPDIEIESNNTISFANPLTKEQAKTGTIFSVGDIDIYGFEAPQAGVIHVDFIPTTTTGDYKISVLDKNGNEKYTKTSIDGDPRTLHYGIESPDHYYIKVEILENGDIDPHHYYEIVMTSNIEIQPIIGLVSISIEAPADQIAINEQIQLTLKKHFSDTSSQLLEGGDLISLQPAVATVDSNGIIAGLANGNATIVCIYEGFIAKFSLTVGSGEAAAQHHGNLIIMTGSGANESDPLTESAQYLSDLVYKRFQNRLFRNEDIFYFNPVSYHDLDGDGYDNNVVDDISPTVNEFGQAISDWAVNQSTDGPLFIYMVGHGEIDTFSFPIETITADQLNGFINTFQSATGRRVVVIIEACKSGTFTDNLVSPGKNIIVVTSADDQDAYLKMSGRISFSQFFIDTFHKGDSIHESWLAAKNKLSDMEPPFSLMSPQLAEGIAIISYQTWLGGDFVAAPIFPGWVLGKVYDAITGLPITSATVYIETNVSANTMDEGYYLCLVPPGTYTITVTADGYQTIILTDEIVWVSDILTRDFGMMHLDLDSDGDGISDVVETASACLDVNDADTDDDCIPDGVEDANRNGTLDSNETDPCDRDSDGDGIQDGTELGYTSADANPDTNPGIFKPDLDPSTTTDPMDDDSDNDGMLDGEEDANLNGRVDSGETNPGVRDTGNQTAMPWIPLLLIGN